VSIANDAELGGIDKNESYDIYYGCVASGEKFVVKRVRIVRIDQINSIEFLVFINDSGFNSKGKEGYILFSTINAIVPSNTFSIETSERFKKY
jgi:hypothetical protein